MMKTVCTFCGGYGCHQELAQDSEGSDFWVEEQCEDCEGTGVIDDED
jgi:DnaJ-class molecular chaperone